VLIRCLLAFLLREKEERGKKGKGRTNQTQQGIGANGFFVAKVLVLARTHEGSGKTFGC
jgi:stalled ribosome alternative rescue factor ArfA